MKIIFFRFFFGLAFSELQTRHMHIWSSFRTFPSMSSMRFHLICRVLRSGAQLSVHTLDPRTMSSPIGPELRSRSDLGIKAAGARPAWTRRSEQVLASLSVVAAARRPATCAPPGSDSR